jgi:hypothetical protein
MNIEINNKYYTIELERALELGILKERITRINIGDVYEYPEGGGTRVCFVEAAAYSSGRFRIIGLNGFGCFSDGPFRGGGATHSETVAWVNEKDLKFVRNINDEVSDLITK